MQATKTKIKFGVSVRKMIFCLVCIFAFIKLYEWAVNTNLLEPLRNLVAISLKDSDYRSFLNAVWQVQTSIAVLTITFIALILNKLETRVFGMKLNEVISLPSSKFRFLNYWEKVWLNLITIALNFFYVARADLTAVSLIFLISIVLTISLFKESLDIITKPESYEKNLKNYVSQRLDEAIKKENGNDREKESERSES